jgi:plastocyanin
MIQSVLLGALAGLSLIPGPRGAPPSPVAQLARSHVVSLKNLAFLPRALTIHRGDSVTWVWRDRGIAHNVTGHGFHSATQTHGSFSLRFTRGGTYSYRCTIHRAQGMVGAIVVR